MTVFWFLDIESAGGGPLDLWTWFYQNITVQGTLNITGLVLLVVLFSRDLILTKGQHERRVADIKAGYDTRIAESLVAHHEAMQAKDDRYEQMLAEKNERYSEMKESRTYYREARLSEQEKNRALVDQLLESNKGLAVAARALGALEEAAAAASGGET